MERHRDKTLDLAKGLSIMLMVLGHAIQFSFGTAYIVSNQFFDNPLFKSIYTFHMPLFMLISGYLFFESNKKKSFREVMSTKLRGIGIPMLTFILLCDLPIHATYLFRGDLVGLSINFIKTIGWGWTMWFLSSILLNVAIMATLVRVVRNRTWRYAILFSIACGSLFVPDALWLSVHKFMFPFFYIGYVLGENDVPVYTCSKNVLAMAVLTLLSIGAICWFDRDTYIYTTGFCIAEGGVRQLCIDGKRMLIALVVSFTFMQYVHILAGTKGE